MPAAPRAALAAPPTRSSLRVSFTVLRRDANERAHHVIEVAAHLLEGERLRNVLAGCVERPVIPPRVEDVPLIDSAVDGVERGPDRAKAPRSASIAEAWRVRLVGLPGDNLDVFASRDLRPPRETAEVDVHVLTRRLVPEEADEPAPVLLDGDTIVPLAADLAVERIRHPGRAVDGRADLDRKAMPGALPFPGALWRLRVSGARAVRVAALGCGLALRLGAG